jgi:hypothetical protein
VFALGLAARIEVVRGTVARRVLIAAVALTTLVAAQGLLAYWLRTIPVDKVTFHQRLVSAWHW